MFHLLTCLKNVAYNNLDILIKLDMRDRFVNVVECAKFQLFRLRGLGFYYVLKLQCFRRETWRSSTLTLPLRMQVMWLSDRHNPFSRRPYLVICADR
jgi:hypothetical protein